MARDEQTPGDPPRRRLYRTATVLMLIAGWLLLQVYWLRADGRWLPGDELTTVLAVEELAQLLRDNPLRFLWEAWAGQRGEYPNLYAAWLGGLATVLGVHDFDSDAPQVLGLTLSVGTLAGTWLLGRRVGGSRVATFATVLLLTSTQWAGLARHVLVDNAASLAVVTATLAWVHAARSNPDRPWKRILLLATGAVACALSKQTAVLTLLPVAAALWFVAPTHSSLRTALAGLRPTHLAGGAALVVALTGPWYVRQFAAQWEYLWGSSASNPGAAGLLQQFVFYPLVLVEQAWPPLVAALLLLALTVRRPRPELRWLPLAMGLNLLLLLVIPKKYPRLVVPMLPLASIWLASSVGRLPRPGRVGVVAVALFGLLANTVPDLPGSRLGAVRSWFINDIDAHCMQRWIEPPMGPEFPWDELLALIAEEAERGWEFRVSSTAWPEPLCEHRATMALGEHLDVRMRRSGLAGRADRLSWDQDGRWPLEEGRPYQHPDFLVTPPGFSCRVEPAVCGERGPPRLLGIVDGSYPDWEVRVELWAWPRQG